MDPLILLREYSDVTPIALNETEQKRLIEIAGITKSLSKNEKRSDLYKEYRQLIIKSAGSRAGLITFRAIENFLGEKHDLIFKKLVTCVPSETEGDQYGIWNRNLMGETSTKELYAYLMSFFLRNYDVVLENGLTYKELTDEALDSITQYAYTYVLQVKDIMAAAAGDDSRELTKEQLREFINEFFKICDTFF